MALIIVFLQVQLCCEFKIVVLSVPGMGKVGEREGWGELEPGSPVTFFSTFVNM